MAQQAHFGHEQDVSVEAGKPERATVKWSGLLMVTLRSKRQVLVVEVVETLSFAGEDRRAVYGRPFLCDIWAPWRKLRVLRYGMNHAGLRRGRCDDDSEDHRGSDA